MTKIRDDIVRCFAIIDYLNRIPSYRVHDWSVYFQQFQQLLDLRLGIVWIVGDRPVANIPDNQLLELIKRNLWTTEFLEVDKVERSKPGWIKVDEQKSWSSLETFESNSNKTIRFAFKTWLWLPIMTDNKEQLGVFQIFSGENIVESFNDDLKETFEQCFQYSIERTPSILGLLEKPGPQRFTTHRSVGDFIAKMGTAVTESKGENGQQKKPLTQSAEEKLTVGSYLYRHKQHIQDALSKRMPESADRVMINFMRYSVRGSCFFYSGIRDPDPDSMLDSLVKIHGDSDKVGEEIKSAVHAAMFLDDRDLINNVKALQPKAALGVDPVAAESAQLFRLLIALLDSHVGTSFSDAYYEFLKNSDEGVKWFRILVDQGEERVQRCQKYLDSLFVHEASNDHRRLKTVDEFKESNPLLQDFQKLFTVLAAGKSEEAKRQLFDLRDSLLMILERIPLDGSSSVPGLVKKTGSAVPFAKQYLYIDNLQQDQTFRNGCLQVADCFESLLLLRVSQAVQYKGVTYPIVSHGALVGLAVLVILEDRENGTGTLRKARPIVEANLVFTSLQLRLAEHAEFVYKLPEMVDGSQERFRSRESRAMDIFFGNFDRIQDHMYARLWEYDGSQPRCVSEQRFVDDYRPPSQMEVTPCSSSSDDHPQIMDGLMVAGGPKKQVVYKYLGGDVSDVEGRIPSSIRPPQMHRHAVFFGESQPVFGIEWVDSVPGVGSSAKLLLYQERLKLIDEHLRGRKAAVDAALLPLVRASCHELKAAALVMQLAASDLGGRLDLKKDAGGAPHHESSEIECLNGSAIDVLDVLKKLKGWGEYAYQVTDYFIRGADLLADNDSKVCLKPLVDKAIDLAKAAAIARLYRAEGKDVGRGVERVTVVADEIPAELFIMAPKPALETLFTNLLINAIEAAAEIAAPTSVAITHDSSRVSIKNPAHQKRSDYLREVVNFVNGVGPAPSGSLGLKIIEKIVRDQRWHMSASLDNNCGNPQLCVQVDFSLDRREEHVKP